MADHYRFDDMPLEKVNDQLQRRLVSGERIMLAQVHLEEGCLVQKHQHDNEQVVLVLEGALRFRLGEDLAEEVIIRRGEVLVLPSNLPHEALALEKSLVADIFSPPRQDWLSRTDDYLRK